MAHSAFWKKDNWRWRAGAGNPRFCCGVWSGAFLKKIHLIGLAYGIYINQLDDGSK